MTKTHLVCYSIKTKQIHTILRCKFYVDLSVIGYESEVIKMNVYPKIVVLE